jgi:predicted dehydrogenase
MIDEKVTQVYCKMLIVQYPEVDDNFHLMITFESGLMAIVEVRTNHYVTHPRWYVMGETGTIMIEDWNCNGKIVRCIDKEDKWAEEIFYTAAGPTKTMAPRNEESTETIELSLPKELHDNLTIVYDQFIDAIEGKAELTIKPEQALRVMRVMEAAFASAESKKSIEVEI